MERVIQNSKTPIRKRTTMDFIGEILSEPAPSDQKTALIDLIREHPNLDCVLPRGD